MTRWRYWLDFFWLPPTIVLVLAIDARSTMWGAMFVFGLILWTLAEYWTHRTLLHVFFWHGTHERHHLHPSDYVETIWWYTPPFFLAALIASWFLKNYNCLGLFTGFAAGYLWFLVMHHLLHHIDLREHTWLHRYAIWHNRHHKLSNCNYGITNPFWDWVFRTSH